MQEDGKDVARPASANDVVPEFRTNEPSYTQNSAAEDNNRSILTRLSSTGRRGAGRSRKGCLTCKRRKVKCGEQRPCCSSCEHLNLECKWNPLPNSTKHRQSRRQSSVRSVAAPTSSSAAPSSAATLHSLEPQAVAKAQGHAVDEVFDYASFMWDSGEFWPQANSPAAAVPVTPTQDSLVGLEPMPEAATDLTMATGSPCPPGLQPASAVPHYATPAEHRLLDIFARSNNPPLLAEVETQSQWHAMRQVVLNMALVSEMIRYAILAFANSVLVSGQGSWDTASRSYYDSALAELSALDSTNLLVYITHREHVVVTLFFIAYVDILESQLEAAHTHLSRAYAIFQPHASRNHGLSSIEKQFFLWFRVLDGRTVSSGGDGSFLSSDEILYMEPSPTSLDGAGDDGSSSCDDGAEGSLEDVLFSVLYQPGITFYQKVLRFNERISKIDPWHRPRGTVRDEMEVMNIAAVIAKDLRVLYDQRPQLLDFAVTGKLTGPQISPELAMAITRSFRTYLSNYYSSKVHLHRVAFNTLPLTREATSALENIRLLARQLVDGLPGEPLPVNMLWPLLMLGVEESSRDERAWIREQMLRMEHVAGNARITAQVLQEVQSRQDTSKGRVDIRLVMIDVFNSSFAFV